MKILAISLALLSALALAVGTQLQNGAVGRQDKATLAETSHLTFRQLMHLIKHPHWLSGAAFSTLALLLQISALFIAPLILVQPIGAIALVITAVINAKVTKTKLNRASITAIAFCTILYWSMALVIDFSRFSLFLCLLQHFVTSQRIWTYRIYI